MQNRGKLKGRSAEGTTLAAGRSGRSYWGELTINEVRESEARQGERDDKGWDKNRLKIEGDIQNQTI